MNVEQVEIAWKQFGNGFVSDLWQFYNSDEFSDVLISTADGKTIKSHRILLAMCSGFFRNLFKHHKGPHHIVCLSNMNSEMVRKIFTLIYTGMVSIAPSMVNDFVAAARYLKLQGFDEIDADIDSDGFSNAERQPDLDRGFQIKLTRIDTVPPSVMNHGAHDMSPAMNALVSSTINPAANEQFFPSTDSSDTSGAEDMSSQNSDAIQED